VSIDSQRKVAYKLIRVPWLICPGVLNSIKAHAVARRSAEQLLNSQSGSGSQNGLCGLMSTISSTSVSSILKGVDDTRLLRPAMSFSFNPPTQVGAISGSGGKHKATTVAIMDKEEYNIRLAMLTEQILKVGVRNSFF